MTGRDPLATAPVSVGAFEDPAHDVRHPVRLRLQAEADHVPQEEGREAEGVGLCYDGDGDEDAAYEVQLRGLEPEEGDLPGHVLICAPMMLRREMGTSAESPSIRSIEMIAIATTSSSSHQDSPDDELTSSLSPEFPESRAELEYDTTNGVIIPYLVTQMDVVGPGHGKR
ncbi:hypothetical protein DL768_006450 [Monosporascus sp. mg162]|nr:hypothetical protein DL768_006450 [Monosporascus sp. mg162]